MNVINIVRTRGRNMVQEIYSLIDELVDAIYSLETGKIDKLFIKLLDELETYIEDHPKNNWNDILVKIQIAYVQKNYVRLSDLMLYELKNYIQE